MNTRTYEREATFVNEVAPSVNVPMPACYFAAVDTVTGDNIVALEDLKAYRCMLPSGAAPINRCSKTRCVPTPRTSRPFRGVWT